MLGPSALIIKSLVHNETFLKARFFSLTSSGKYYFRKFTQKLYTDVPHTKKDSFSNLLIWTYLLTLFQSQIM